MSNSGWLILGLITTGAFIGGYAIYLVRRHRRLTTLLKDQDRGS